VALAVAVRAARTVRVAGRRRPFATRERGLSGPGLDGATLRKAAPPASAPPRLRAELRIGAPDDRFEQEADRVAEKVMRQPEPHALERAALSRPPRLATRIQRACKECEEELSSQPLAIQRTCSKCEEERSSSPLTIRRTREQCDGELSRRPLAIQRTCSKREEERSGHSSAIQRTCSERADESYPRPAEETIHANAMPGRTPEVTRDPGARIDGLLAGGRPLPESVRAFFEPRFGHDFRRVRIHTDEGASESARALNARAYTLGRHIVFARGEYASETAAGRRLLAHELAHTVQQETAGGSAAVAVQRTIGDGHDLRSPRFAGDGVLEAVFDDERLLRVGSRGGAVRKVQQALVDAGFALPRFGVDGIFGRETRRAVVQFQTVFGLKVDGIVGPQTMGRLDEHYATHDPPPVCPVAPDAGAVATLAESLEAEPPPAGCTVPPGKGGACEDGEVSLERDPLPVPAWDVRFVHGSTMRDVFKRPEVARARPTVPPEEVLGLTVPVEPIDTWRDASAATRLGKKLGPQCFECVVDWKLITPTVRSFVATDWAFTPENGLWHGGPDDPCPTSPQGVMKRTPVVHAITPDALLRIHFAEMEHFQDFAFAFHIVSARYLATLRRLRSGRSHLRGRNKTECELKALFFLLPHTGFIPPSHIGLGHDVDFIKAFAQSGKGRDDSGDHRVAVTDPPRHLKAKRPVPRFNCFFHRRLTAASFPRVPGPATQDVIADLGSPPLHPWHVL